MIPRRLARALRQRLALRARLASLELRLLRAGVTEPLPLRHWQRRERLLSLLSTAPNPGSPRSSTARTALARAPELQRLLVDQPVGAWALEADTIVWLWDRLLRDRPLRLLELGAGTSTLVLAAYAAGHSPGGSARVLSIEQDAQVRNAVLEKVARAGLARQVHIEHVPVTPDGAYDPRALAGAAAAFGPVDAILVDGPAGPSGCRAGVLPTVLPAASPAARWYLDDALRSSELALLGRWAETPRVVVEGILPLGQGLAIGFVQGD